MKFHGEQVKVSELSMWRENVRQQGRRLVVTNGCFDVLHAGHIKYLRDAQELGDLLLVGLNGDTSVRELKGPNRPVNSEGDRAEILTALRFVDAVCVFHDVRATLFLGLAKPDIYVKGGDYTLDTLNPAERAEIESVGGKIAFIPFLAGRSTTVILSRESTTG